MNERTCSSFLLGALSKLVVKHAVLLASGGVLHDGVDAPVFGLGDTLPC